MRLAFISDNKVKLIEEFNSFDDAQFITRQYQNAMEVSPEVQVGWVLLNGQLVDPANLKSTNNTLMTKGKFLDRFTIPELIAIETYAASANAGAPVVKVLLRKLNESECVDVKYPVTVQGIMAMVSMGLLTPERADFIMNSPIQSYEKYEVKR